MFTPLTVQTPNNSPLLWGNTYLTGLSSVLNSDRVIQVIIQNEKEAPYGKRSKYLKLN